MDCGVRMYETIGESKAENIEHKEVNYEMIFTA